MKHEAVLQFKATVEKIPTGDADDPEFQAWCRKHKVQPYGGARRGWFGNLSTYLHDAAYLVTFDDIGYGHWRILMTAAEYEQAFVK